jgi:HAE1 family hydrophobic/amphiphilic exporter-1
VTLPEFSLRRPVTVVMAFVSLLVLGAVSMHKLRLEWLPQVNFPQIYVQVIYPDSHPSQVEREVIKPLEEQLAMLRHVRSMRSTCGADEGAVELEFDWGQSIDAVRLEVSEKVEQAKAFFPPGAGPVFIYSFSTSDIPVLEARISAPGVDLTTNYALLERLVKNRLERIPGVARVDISGVAPKEIYIDLNLDKIIEHGVDVSALVNKLAGLNADVAAGEVTDKGMRYILRSLGAMHGIEDYENVLVNARGLRLKDVAEVRYEEPALGYGRHLHREYAVALSIYKESTANTVSVAQEASRVIREEISRDPRLRDVSLWVFNDQAKDITEGLNGLFMSGLLGGLIAMGVLWVFLRRMAPTLILMLAVPVSVIGACTLLYLLGHTLNILSMMGLMLGVGMLVDNSIVVLENTFRRRAQGQPPPEAARDGASEVAMAVTASTLTSLIVFLPLIVGTKTEISVWLAEMGLSLSLTLICSLLVSLTLVPLLAARMRGRMDAGEGKIFLALKERYTRILRWTLEKPLAAGGIVLALLLSTAVPQKLGFSDTEQAGQGGMRMRPALRYDFSDFRYRSQVERVVKQVEDYLYGRQKEFGLESVYTYFEENFAVSILTFADPSLDSRATGEIQDKIKEGLPRFPGVDIGFWEFGGGRGGGGEEGKFSIYLYGDDSERLHELALRTEKALETLPEIKEVRAGEKFRREEVQVRVDRALAQRHGITPMEISRIFYFTLGGQRLRRFRSADHEVDVTLGLRGEDRQNIEDMKKMVVRSVEGRGVPLGTFAEFGTARKPATIDRRDRKTTATVAATYTGEQFEEFRKAVRERMRRVPFPSGYGWDFSQEIREEEESSAQMMANIWLALLLVYLLIASLFESLLHPFAIIFTIPFAMVGVMWGLFLSRTPFNIMSMIGVLVLLGIVVNNGIVLIDHVNHLRRSGMPRKEALLQGCAERMRAVLMTALTTILGLLPMALGNSGIGGAYYYPLARTVMAGLAFSTLLTLLMLPYVYTLLEKGQALSRTIRTPRTPSLPEASRT